MRGRARVAAWTAVLIASCDFPFSPLTHPFSPGPPPGSRVRAGLTQARLRELLGPSSCTIAGISLQMSLHALGFLVIACCVSGFRFRGVVLLA